LQRLLIWCFRPSPLYNRDTPSTTETIPTPPGRVSDDYKKLASSTFSAAVVTTTTPTTTTTSSATVATLVPFHLNLTMSSTRPPINRTYSSRSQVGVLESPALSTSSASFTPDSIRGDQDPMDHHANHDGRSRSNGDMVERGRSPVVEREVYGEDDARSMSPRRNSEELEKIGREAKATLEQWVPSPGSLRYHGISSLTAC